MGVQGKTKQEFGCVTKASDVCRAAFYMLCLSLVSIYIM